MNFTYLSLGAGVQSSALMAMSALGLKGCPKADVAIFADTQDEPPWVYEQVAALATFGGIHGIPVVVVSKGKLSADRRVQLPAFVLNNDGDVGPLKRSCTQDYKTRVCRREARRLMALGGALPKKSIFAPISCAAGITGRPFLGRRKEP